MNAAASTAAQPEHPAPHRHLVPAWTVWFGLVMPPLAWAMQLAVNVSMFGHGCYPNDVPLAEPLWPNLRAIALAIEVLAALGCVVAGGLTVRNWRRTRHEKAGSEEHLLGGGDGRTRFLAMVGMLLSALFLFAIVLSTLNLTAVRACGG
jgi:hypothetical protein